MRNFQTFKEHAYKRKAFQAAFWNVLGTVLSLLFGSVILFTFSEPDKIISFVDRGDFCLYSAGLLSSSLFVLSENKKNIRNWYNSMLYPSAFLLIIISAALYCAIFIASDLIHLPINVNVSSTFVHLTSYLLILFSLIITYRALLIDFKYRPPEIDPVKKEEEQVQNIMNQL